MLLAKLEGGKVVLTLRNDYGGVVPPQLEPFGGDWWTLGWFADARDGLESYADEFGRLNEVKLDGLHIGMATRQTYPNRQYVEDKFGDAGFEFWSNRMIPQVSGFRPLSCAASDDPSTHLLARRLTGGPFTALVRRRRYSARRLRRAAWATQTILLSYRPVYGPSTRALAAIPLN